jgi:hypothetical protein
MNISSHLQRWVLLPLLLSLPGPLQGQTVPAKTVASPRGQQFFFLPTSRVGMGELLVAADDPLRDPFLNPAIKGDWPLRFSLTPTIYRDKRKTVQGRTFPFAALIAGNIWFGTFAFALQELEEAPKEIFSLPSELNGVVDAEEPSRNTYLLGSIGRRIGSKVSFGLKLAYGELELLDGERRLHPSALALSQAGETRTVTLGTTYTPKPDHSFRATLSNSLVEMEHEWTGWRRRASEIPGIPGPAELWSWTDGSRFEAWEGRVHYTLSIPRERLRLTAMASLRKRDQSRVPGYDLVHIPFDPGSTTIGEFGLAWDAVGPLFRLAIEAGVSPGSAETTILADSAQSLNGTTLQPGDPAFGHDFRFNNWWATAGVDVPIRSGGFQLGLGARGHRFRLDQRDHLRGEDHEYKISWTEWMPSLGVRAVIWGVEMGYAVRLINRGTAPCDPHSYRSRCRPWPVPYHFTGLRVAPTLPEDLPDFSFTTHQLTVSVPLGRARS